MSGVRTELVFEEASGCPVAAASGDVPGPVTDVNWADDGGETVTEQVTVEDGELDEFDAVFEYGTQQVYEFGRDKSDPCICEHIQANLGPITDVHARDGDLHVTLHAGDVSGLRDLVSEMRDQFDGLRIEYLVHSVEDNQGGELVPVDLRRLTDRQREVLETAHEMGYFEYPRESNATEVAAELEIQPSTFAEHLAAAQGKLYQELLET